MTFSHIRYQILPEGIHEITMLAVSKQAVDEWMQITLEIETSAVAEKVERLYFLLDHSVGMQPLSYSFSRGRETASKIFDLEDDRPTFFAFLYPTNSTFLLSIISGFVNSVSRHEAMQWRFFPMTEREAALIWLHEMQKQRNESSA